MKKVLHVVEDLNVGGIQLVSFNYYKYIDKNEYTFDYVVFGEKKFVLEEELLGMGARIIRIEKPQFPYVDYLRDLKKIFNEYGPYDIVHSHVLFNSAFVMFAASLANIPKRIAHAHSDRGFIKVGFFRKVKESILRRVLRSFSTNYLACSSQAGEFLFGDNFFEKGKVIPNGIRINDFKYNKLIRDELRTELQINEKFVIGHVGAFSDPKNHEFILKVFKSISDNLNSDAVLVLVGDGKLRASLKEIVETYNLTEKVLFLGSRNDTNDLLNVFDVFIFPSKYEGLGIALIEAQANYLSCIISDKIAQEAIINRNIQVLSLDDDITKWAEKIVSAPQRNINYAEQKKINDYSIESMMTKLYEVYND